MAFRSVPRPSSPPGAKASTECPSYARDQGHGVAKLPHRDLPNPHPHHAQKPSSGDSRQLPVLSRQTLSLETEHRALMAAPDDPCWISSFTPHTTGSHSSPPGSHPAANNTIVPTPLNPRRPTAGALASLETALPVRHAAEQRTRHPPPAASHQIAPTTHNRESMTGTRVQRRTRT
jgi:hypothetical protein